MKRRTATKKNHQPEVEPAKKRRDRGREAPKTGEPPQVEEQPSDIPVVLGNSTPIIGEFSKGSSNVTVNPETLTANTNLHVATGYDNPNLLLTADLDIGSHVPLSLKQKIWDGDFINLALLLKGSSELINHCNGGDLYIDPETGKILSRPSQLKEKVLTIEKWTDAFLIYMNIFLMKNQAKFFELIKYVTIIRSAASRCPHGDFSWRTYDEQFRLRLRTEPSMSWAHINSDLWAMTMVRPVVNTSGGNHYKPSYQSPNLGPMTSKVCFDFNKGSCFRTRCKFLHQCSNCAANNHNLITCPNKQSNNSFRSKNTSQSRQGQYQQRKIQPGSFANKN